MVSTITLPELVVKIRESIARGPTGPYSTHVLEQASAKARNELLARGIDINERETARTIAGLCDAIGCNVTDAFGGEIIIKDFRDVARFYNAFTEITGGTCAAIVERHGGAAR